MRRSQKCRKGNLSVKIILVGRGIGKLVIRGEYVLRALIFTSRNCGYKCYCTNQKKKYVDYQKNFLIFKKSPVRVSINWHLNAIWNVIISKGPTQYYPVTFFISCDLKEKIFNFSIHLVELKIMFLNKKEHMGRP